MGEVLRVDSPAKLNLMLRVTGRREDGYHLLETVFQFIDLREVIPLSLGKNHEPYFSSSISAIGSNSSSIQLRG